jgi:hypothetical protein
MARDFGRGTRRNNKEREKAFTCVNDSSSIGRATKAFTSPFSGTDGAVEVTPPMFFQEHHTTSFGVETILLANQEA